MYCYKLICKNPIGGIPKGYELQVVSRCSTFPYPEEVIKAAQAQGFKDFKSINAVGYRFEVIKL